MPQLRACCEDRCGRALRRIGSSGMVALRLRRRRRQRPQGWRARIPSARQKLPHADVAPSLWAAPGLGISSGFPESLRSCSLTTKSPSKAAGKSYAMASQESKALTLTVLGSGTYAFVLICAAPHCHVPPQGPLLETGCLRCLLKASARRLEHDWIFMLTV